MSEPKRPASPIGERITQAREAAGLDRPAFAAALKLAYETAWRYEAGERVPRPEALAQIAQLLGVSMEWLVTGVGDMARADAAPTGTDGA